VLRYEAVDAFDDEEATHVVGMPSSVVEAAGHILDHDEPTDPGLGDAVAASSGIAAGMAPDEPEPVQHTEDVMEFVLRSGSSQSNLGIDRKKPKVLEVNQTWESIVLDTKHYGKRGKSVTIGTTTGYQWSFIGINLGWVPGPLAMILPYAPPMWSEVNAASKNDFYVSDESLPGGKEHKLFNWKGSQYVADIAEDWDGFAEIGEERLTFDEMVARGKATKGGRGYQVPVDDDTKLMINANGTVFYSHMVPAGKRVAAAFLDNIDFLCLGILALAAFLGLMFGLLIACLPRPPDSSAVSIDEGDGEVPHERQEQEDETD